MWDICKITNSEKKLINKAVLVKKHIEVPPIEKKKKKKARHV